MVLFGGACRIEARKILWYFLRPWVAWRPLSMKMETNTGEVRVCRISGDKDCARSSGLFMTCCTRVVEGRIDAPGKNEDTQREIRGSYATHGNSCGLAQLSLSWIQMSQRSRGAQKITVLRAAWQTSVLNALEALSNLIGLWGLGGVQAHVSAVKFAEMVWCRYETVREECHRIRELIWPLGTGNCMALTVTKPHW